MFISHKGEVISASDEAVEKALTMIGLQMEGYAKESLTSQGAVDTGRLRGSITFATETEHSSGQSPAEAGDYNTLGKPEKCTVTVGTNVEYAPYIEFGTSKMADRPYLRPTVTDHLNEYKEILESCLKE